MSVHPCHEPNCDNRMSSETIELVIESRARDLGGFEVRRLLPAASRQRVGPFIFLDEMGPARFPDGTGIDVRPHPHIGLATVTYLFEGVIQHRDSLGFDQAITPGAVNWMTAGRGIAHSERTPQKLREGGSSLHGLQAWLVLPEEAEETSPSFVHHPAASIPQLTRPGARLTLIAGEAWGERSPVQTASPTLYLAGSLEEGAELEVPDGVEERALYVIDGELLLDGETLPAGTLAVLREGSSPRPVARGACRLALFGGAPIEGERHLWWNFVSSSPERIERAKANWRDGRFPEVLGDPESIPLPED